MVCLAEFLDFGPEIWTRDLNQAQKNSGSRMQKKKKSMHVSPPQGSAETLGRAQEDNFFLFFFFFCASDFQ